MNIEEYFQDNKKILKLMLVIYIIISIAIIYFIWKPKDEVENLILKYEEVDEAKVNENIINEYMNAVVIDFVLEQKEVLKEIVNPKYLQYRNISSDDLMSELEENGFFVSNIRIKDIEKYQIDDTYVYRGILTNGTNERYINIIEKYPYDYNITFDTFFDSNSQRYEISKNKIKFEIIETINLVSKVEYKIKITNVGNENVTFNFNDNKKISILLEDDQEYTSEYPLGAIYKEVNLAKGSSIIIDILFRVPLQNQEKIDSINFKDVRLDVVEEDIKIEL